MDKVPSEVILISAAFAYMASAALWSNQAQLRKAFSQYKMPSIHLTAVKLPMPSMNVSAPAQTAAQAPVATTAGESPNAVATEKTADHSVAQPAAASSNSGPQVHEPQAPAPQSTQESAHSTISREHGRARRNSAVVQGSGLPLMAPASEQVKEDLAEYNRLLAVYFESAGDSSQARPEPPSYSEWLAAGKPQF
jgi:hypothetical protein